MCSQNRTAEQILASIGGDEHGVVTRIELIAAGMTPRQIHHRVQRGDLIPRFRGVYRVGHAAPSLDAHYLAAVRACGEQAVLFRRPAAYLFGLIKGPAPQPEVLTVTERRIAGVVTHRTRLLDRRDIATLRGIRSRPSRASSSISPRLSARRTLRGLVMRHGSGIGLRQPAWTQS